MKISETQQKIIIESLRCYREKLSSMKIDTQPVKELLKDVRGEIVRLEKEAEKLKDKEQDSRHPLTGKIVGESGNK